MRWLSTLEKSPGLSGDQKVSLLWGIEEAGDHGQRRTTQKWASDLRGSGIAPLAFRPGSQETLIPAISLMSFPFCRFSSVKVISFFPHSSTMALNSLPIPSNDGQGRFSASSGDVKFLGYLVSDLCALRRPIQQFQCAAGGFGFRDVDAVQVVYSLPDRNKNALVTDFLKTIGVHFF